MWQNTQRLIETLVPRSLAEHENLRCLFNAALAAHKPVEGIDVSLSYEALPTEIWGPPVRSRKLLRDTHDSLKYQGLLTAHAVAGNISALGFMPEDDVKSWRWACVNVHILLALTEFHKSERPARLLASAFRRALANPAEYGWILDALGMPSLTFKATIEGMSARIQEIAAMEATNTSPYPRNAAKRLTEIRSAYRLAMSYFPDRLTSSSANGVFDNEPPPFTKKTSLVSQGDHVDKALTDWINPVGRVSNIAQREHHFWSDERALPPSDMQNLSSRLINEAEEGDSASVILLLTLHSGNPIEYWRAFLAMPSGMRPDEIKVNTTRQIYALERQLGLPKAQADSRYADFYVNSSQTLWLPLPASLIRHCLEHKKSIDNESINAKIRMLKQSCRLPVLSQNRIERALFRSVKRGVKDRVVADIIIGTTPKHDYTLNYSSYRLHDLLKYYRQAIAFMLGDNTIEGGDYLNPDLPDIGIGSEKALSTALITAFMRQLKKSVETQIDYVARMNAHTLWIWHVFMLLTSVRAVNDLPGSFEEVDLSGGWCWLSDKEERPGNKSVGRFLPLCDFLVQAMIVYNRKLDQCLQQHSALNRASMQYSRDRAASKKPLFALYVNERWIPVTVKHVMDSYNGEFPSEPNWTRHYGRWFLSSTDCPIHLIDAVFGHEGNDKEILNPYSSTSLNDLAQLKSYFQQSAAELQLAQVDLDE